MNRADLSWALKAVLPHTGSSTEALDRVGLDFREGVLFAYATDRYTLGIARANNGADIHCALTTKEATELMRFVRPGRVFEQGQEIVYAVKPPGELHIGYALDEDGEDVESAVFETTDYKIDLDFLLSWVDRANDSPVEWDECIYLTRTIDRFTEARRSEGDRLRILPRRHVEKHGVAVVTVGYDFLGGISGLTYDQSGAATVADFLAEGKAA